MRQNLFSFKTIIKPATLVYLATILMHLSLIETTRKLLVFLS